MLIVPEGKRPKKVRFKKCTPRKCSGCYSIKRLTEGNIYEVFYFESDYPWIQVRGDQGYVDFFSKKHFELVE